MGIALYFSNQLMPLADRLYDDLAAGASEGTALAPEIVIVPNMNLSKWIKLTLARRSGIFMNVRFEYLERGLWQMIRSLADLNDVEPELLDRERMTILLFFIFMAPDRDAPELIPVNRYLNRFNENAGGDMGIRCWQLAEELARLFQEYDYHRADMIQRWMADKPVDDAMERCQKWIFREMMLLKEQLGQARGRPLASMVEYARDILDAAGAGQAHCAHAMGRVHFFGLSQISPFHLQLLSRLQSCFDIRIYSLNPSREYWEDIKTPAEKKWIHRKTVGELALSQEEILAGDLFTPVDHALLSAWGKPGRESVRLLCQLTDYDFEAGFSAMPPPTSVLNTVSHRLLTLDAATDAPASLAQDTSLQMVACPGIRREVEMVYNSILFNLDTHPQLCMTDIAVMVSDMARYKPVVDSVFSRQPVRITYNLVDSNARTESVFAQAVLAVMDLSQGNFSRKQVFDLLRNPCVMNRWNYGSEELSIWVDWADALGIFHDYENADTREPDGPPAGRFSWRQGLQRLRLSRIMTAPVSVEGAPQRHFKGIVPFTDLHTGDNRLVEKFCSLVESLHAAMGMFKISSASAQDWRQTFFRVLDQFVDIGTDMRGEESVYQSLVAAFDHFLLYDDLVQIRPGRPLTVDAMRAFVRSHLDGITGGQGDYLTGGVTVSALMPMRPIPFKMVYVLGLEEGRFPGHVPDSLLDLRNRKRRIGDISLAERNRYLFLEILISVRDKLYLSYVSRDLQKDRELAPCSVLLQLKRYLEKEVLGGQAFRINSIPINADSPAYLEPEAVNGWSDVVVDYNLVNRLCCYRRSGLWDAFADRASVVEQERADRYHPDFSMPNGTVDDDPTSRLPLPIAMLRHFLLDPVEMVGQYHLGIAEQVDVTAERAEVEDEPLTSRFPVDYRLRTIPLKNWMASRLIDGHEPFASTRLEDEFDAVYADLSRKSLVPGGAFGRRDRSRLKQEVVCAGGTLIPFVEQMQAARQLFPAVVVGTPPDDADVVGGDILTLNAVSIAPAASTANPSPPAVELSGVVPWVWEATGGSWHCLVPAGSNRRSKRPDKYMLGPLLSLMTIGAGNESYPWFAAGCMRIHVVYREHVLSVDYVLDPQRCSDYLSALLGDWLNPWPLAWLPFEPLVDSDDLRTLILQDEVTDDDRQTFAELLKAAMKAAADWRSELTGARVTSNSLDLARQRFRPLLP
jgi:exodeoxyribonuclease V gamma subunit